MTCYFCGREETHSIVDEDYYVDIPEAEGGGKEVMVCYNCYRVIRGIAEGRAHKKDVP